MKDWQLYPGVACTLFTEISSRQARNPLGSRGMTSSGAFDKSTWRATSGLQRRGTHAAQLRSLSTKAVTSDQ